MSETGLYDSLQIASNFIEQAEKLASTNEFESAFATLKKAKSYAFNNDALLDDIQLRHETLTNARRHYIRQLEEESVDLFNQELFDSQKARQALQALRQQDNQNEIAQSLWEELQAKEAAEREHRLVNEVQQELEGIWQKARELEKIGDGSEALVEYEQAVVEASIKAGDAPDIIPLQRFKLMAIEKRDQCQEKWEEIPSLILAGKGLDLVERYEMLKTQGETDTEFFDANGKFVGYLPIDDCIDRANELARQFAEQKIQDYLDQSRKLLTESPGAAYEKIQEAFEAIAASDPAKDLLEQEIEEKIQPAIEQRETALALLNVALSNEDPIKTWATLNQVEQMDRFTPGLVDTRQQLAPVVAQNLTHLIETGEQLLGLEDFETAQMRFKEAVNIGQTVATYNEVLQELHTQAQEALDRCLQMQQAVKTFEQQLTEIAELSQTEPERANEALAALETDGISEQVLTKIEHLRVQIDFQLGVDRLLQSLEQKMVATTDPLGLITIEEGAKQACLDYPDEERFPRLVERIVARRAFLKGSALCEDPEKYVEALDFLQQVVDLQGDDASRAQSLIDKISVNEQQEADIATAIEEATNALDKDDPRSAFLVLQTFRFAASRQAGRVQELISTATTRWRNDIEQQLEELVATQDFILPKVEFLIRELQRAQSPRIGEWQLKALAPAYAVAAKDLQELDCWSEAEPLWEEAFRLSPQDPTIVKGRRNAHKHQAIVRMKTTIDPAEKELLLNDLNRVYSDDPLIKRYLAAFYFSQKRYAETRLALSQAKSLLGHSGNPISETSIEVIRHMEMRLQETETVEKRKSAILRQLKETSTISQLKDVRMVYEKLVEAMPEQSKSLERWWTELTDVRVNALKSQVAEISDKAGTAWVRAQLLCKILVFKADPQIQKQAQRVLKLCYDQLPPDVKMVAENREGVGFGRAFEALDNHVEQAKALYDRVDEMNQLEHVMTELGIESVSHETDLNDALYKLELALEKLYFTQEKQREIKHQIAVGLVTGKWKMIEDSLQELELKGWDQHQGVQSLLTEVEKAKRKRANLEAAVKQINEAMAQEKFKFIQERLAYMTDYDPDDETQLQAGLEVVDAYTGDKIKGLGELENLIPNKQAITDKLNQWQIEEQPLINWPIVRSKIADLASQGQFKPAIELAQAAIGQNNEHSLMRNDSRSLEHEHQYLETFPITSEEVNSCYASALFDHVNQRTNILRKQINECEALIEDLQENQQTFKQLLNQLKPLFKRLDTRKDFLRSIFSSSAEEEETKQQILRLVKQGSQICPDYPAFANFDEDKFLKY